MQFNDTSGNSVESVSQHKHQIAQYILLTVSCVFLLCSCRWQIGLVRSCCLLQSMPHFAFVGASFRGTERDVWKYVASKSMTCEAFDIQNKHRCINVSSRQCLYLLAVCRSKESTCHLSVDNKFWFLTQPTLFTLYHPSGHEPRNQGPEPTSWRTHHWRGNPSLISMTSHDPSTARRGECLASR